MLLSGLVSFAIINDIVGAIIYIPVTLIVITKTLKIIMRTILYAIIVIFSCASSMLFIYVL